MKTTESMNPCYILLYQTIVYILSGRGKARSPLPRSNSISCMPVFVSFFSLSMSVFSSYLVGHFISVFVLLFWFSFVRFYFRTKGTLLLLSVWPIALVIDSLACAIFMRILFGVSIILAIDIISIAHSNGNKFKHSI